jgi:hypothetical protein
MTQEYPHGFAYKEHEKVPGQFFITRYGKKYTPPGLGQDYKTTYISQEQCHATIQQLVQRISAAVEGLPCVPCESVYSQKPCSNGTEVRPDLQDSSPTDEG